MMRTGTRRTLAQLRAHYCQHAGEYANPSDWMTARRRSGWQFSNALLWDTLRECSDSGEVMRQVHRPSLYRRGTAPIPVELAPDAGCASSEAERNDAQRAALLSLACEIRDSLRRVEAALAKPVAVTL